MKNENRDPTALYYATDVSERELILLDPLDITQEMVEQAECPELADPVLGRVPERKFSLTTEVLLRKAALKHALARGEIPTPGEWLRSLQRSA